MASVTINGETLVQAIVRDNSECVARRRMVEDEIRHLAFYDPLTGLANRTLLLDRLRQALSASARNLRQGALLFIDLDNFKWLNDTLGHDQGDLLLQQVAQRLIACVRENDTVARFGGDEFVVMLEDLSDVPQRPASQVQTVGEKILNALNQPYTLAGNDYPITPSIGVTLFINHRNTVDELLKQADLAMYQAKAAGRNGLRFFDPSMQAALEQRAALAAELRLAVKEHRFLLYYQTQVNSDSQITGVEALLRWQHPERGLVSPATFIPLAEDTGLIRPMGYWVLEAACRQLAAWARQPETRHLTLAVNVSAHQFRQTDFVDQVLTVLARAGADPRKLKLELTESVLLDDVDAVAKMRALKARGVGFSLDDFGTGYSSLAYLKKLPLDELKIAQSFVRDILSDLNDAAIARTILSLGQTFGLAVIAEGVETPNQHAFLASYGCTAYQGYLFGEPGPAEALRLETVDSP
jgi:diguanylate cyclase (GGDEF)-like protein